MPTATPEPTATVGPTATPGPTTRVRRIRATADTWIARDRPRSNHGAAKGLLIDRSPRREALLRFRVSGLGGARVLRAQLELTVTHRSRARPALIAYRTGRRNARWHERGVTWATAPARLGRRLGRLGPVAAGRTYRLDLADYVRRDGTYSVRLVAPHGDGVRIASREARTGRPTLVLTTTR
jgi:hypothetical protein